MKNIFIDEKLILKYIEDSICSSKLDFIFVENAKYHHNTRYSNAVSICQNGILTMLDLNNHNIIEFSPEILKKFSDDIFHVNGIDSVSLSIFGMDDLSKDEEEYCPFDPRKVDFLVSSDVKTIRNSTNYGNEFLSLGSIDIDKIKSIDIRLMDLIDKYDKNSTYTIEQLVNKYNILRDIAYTIKEFDLDIPLREMSRDDEFTIDVDYLSKKPKLIIK